MRVFRTVTSENSDGDEEPVGEDRAASTPTGEMSVSSIRALRSDSSGVSPGEQAAQARRLLKKCASTNCRWRAWSAESTRLELQAHADAAVAPRDARLDVDLALARRQAERGRASAAPASSGLVVRMAMPPRLRFSVSAVAMVLPNRYATGMPSTTRGLPRRLKLSGNRCGASDGRMCCTALYSLTYPTTPSEAQLAHFVGADDRAAEDEDRQAAVVDLADRAHQVHARRVAAAADRATIEIDVVQVGADLREQLRRRCATGMARWPASSSAVLNRSRTNAGVVGNDDRLGGHGRPRHPCNISECDALIDSRRVASNPAQACYNPNLPSNLRTRVST